MSYRLMKWSAVWVIVLGLYLGWCTPLSAAKPIISVEGNTITLENDAGCKLVIWHDNGKYGLGTFYFDGVALGEPIKSFVTEDNIFPNSHNRFQRIWPGTWHPYWQASHYQIIENTQEHGAIKFWGRMGKLGGAVTITLSNDGTGYKLNYDMDVLETIKHPLYVSGPFHPEKMQFVQFPFETPLVPPFTGHWSITPTLSMVPLMFGCDQIDQRDYYVGVGYQLEKDHYQRGKIEYDAAKTAPFQIYFVSPDDSGWFGGGNIKLHMVISTAANQYDCISGYRKMSGYDVSTPIRRTLAESLKRVMEMYKNCTAYVSLPPFKNKAYHQQIVPASGAPPLDGYGAYIPIGMNVQLAYQFYKYWQAHPEQTWARERAFTMANFFVEVQTKQGAVPSLWDPKEKRFRTYLKEIDDGGYIYTTDRQAIGAYSLYRLYLARKETENVAVEEWKESALKAMDYIVDKIQPNGFLGRSYNDKDEYDTGYAPNAVLIALDYFHAQTGDKKYDEARARLERWVYEIFVRTNHWFDWSSDMGGWSGQGPPPWDIDALDTQSFATYCAYRHMRTGEQKYIDWAKHVVSYNWLVTIPVQFSGFGHVTKGLTREQDHYLTYDVPFRTSMFIDCYPYLSLITQDRFFIDFYKMLIQTQMAYQYPNEWPRLGLQSFDIGLWWDASGANPRDEVGEPEVNYIVEFCSLFLESVTSPNAYRYVGCPDWGVGLDYDLSFTPDFKEGQPYLISASTEVTTAHWDAQSRSLSVRLNGEAGNSGLLNVKWNVERYPLADIRVEMNGQVISYEQCEYSENTGILTIPYMHDQPILLIKVYTHS
jgi:hypothetical protein